MIPILQPFHKIFANSNGTYVEYDTKGDQKYNPTGILRIHVKGGHPQLGPSDGLASFMNSDGISLGLGVSWQTTDGSWASLAEQVMEPSDVIILEESNSSVQFKINYLTIDSVNISETITIADNKVIVFVEIQGHKGRKRINWPVLVFDGQHRTTITEEAQSISLNLNHRGVRFQLMDDNRTKLSISEETYKHRNGIVRMAHAEFEGSSVTFSIEANK